MPRNVVERHCELANKKTQQLYKVSTPCIDDHHFKEEKLKSVGELSEVCSQIVLKCSYLARIGRPDILWSVNKIARSITKQVSQCGTPSQRTSSQTRSQRLARAIHTTRVNLSNIVMWEILHNSAGWDCFRALTLPEILKTQNRPQGNFVHIWKSHARAKKLDVPEANVSFTQFNGI